MPRIEFRCRFALFGVVDLAAFIGFLKFLGFRENDSLNSLVIEMED